MRIIDVEAHLYTPTYADELRRRSEPPRTEAVGDDQLRVWQEPSAPDVFQQRSMHMEALLRDQAELRIPAMDADDVDVQVLSLNIPGCEQFEPSDGARVARTANDELAALVAEHPDRLVGLAAVAPDPERPDVAADEVERCVMELGFRGVKINSHVRDTSLDDPRYWPLFERTQALRVPIFFHPIIPHASMIRPYTGYGWALVGPGLGFGHETAVQTMRLVYSGLFDRFPDLQIVLGHLGEGLYFWLYRLDFDFTKPWLAGAPKLERRPSDYLRENFHVTISGHFQMTSFMSTLEEIGVGRMMFATDYPYESVRQAIEFVESAPLSREDKEKIFHGNASALLGLD